MQKNKTMEMYNKYRGKKGTNVVPQKELTSLGNCFTNDKFMIEKSQ